MNAQDLWIALLSLLDVVSGAVLAIVFGFYLLPAAAGFLVAAIGSLLTGSLTPISFQQENLALARNLSSDLRTRVSMILVAAFLTGVIGLLGLPQYVVDTVGREIFLGMLAGVGLYLTKVGWELSQQDKGIGLPCLVVAILVQLATNNLIWAVTASVPLGIVLKYLRDRTKEQKEEIPVPHYSSWQEALRREFRVMVPRLNINVLVGALALSTLTLGGNIAYTAVNLGVASSTTQNYNQVSVISGLADFASSLFGGASLEVIVSATAAAPHPVTSGVFLMVGAAIVILTGLVYKVARYVPIAAMGGYLVVIGAILVTPFNALDAFNAGNPVVVSLTMATTVFTNPFYGLVVGVLVKLVMGWFGVL